MTRKRHSIKSRALRRAVKFYCKPIYPPEGTVAEANYDMIDLALIESYLKKGVKKDQVFDELLKKLIMQDTFTTVNLCARPRDLQATADVVQELLIDYIGPTISYIERKQKEEEIARAYC